ncbi:MAG: hypothetical protein Ct9H300mP28_30150 [Pseudomonadota bacterium]|nr:MAG: hypothetical protein Ct9H300mP28_30150 [Pseudomonadota bacterium]
MPMLFYLLPRFREKKGTFTNTNRQVQLGRQAMNPQGMTSGLVDHTGNANVWTNWNYQVRRTFMPKFVKQLPAWPVYVGTPGNRTFCNLPMHPRR